jgi:hypothetical protein
MANIVADPNSTCHGVLHRVTHKEFAVLKEIESNYETAQLLVMPYKPHVYSSNSNKGSTGAGQSSAAGWAAPTNGLSAAPSTSAAADAGADGSSDSAKGVLGTPVMATAFIAPPAGIAAMVQEHPEWGNSLPSDRYIRIITAGLRHFGADPTWVAWVAAQDCKHGREPHQYLKLPVPVSGQQQGQEGRSTSSSSSGAGPAQLRSFTMQQLAQDAGKLQDNKAYFAVGPKVVELDVSSKPEGPMVAIIQKHFAGKQAAFHMCMMLHEPRLPPISTPADVRKEHIEWAEDMVMEFMAGYGFPAKQVGWVVDDSVQNGPDAAAVVKDAAEAVHEGDEASTAPESGVWR